MTAEPRTFPTHRSATAPEDLREGIEVSDERFLALSDADASVEKHYTGCEWAEGPVYFLEGDYVLWSDIPNNRMLKFDAGSDVTTVFREPCNNTNGHYRDQQGRLVSCEHSANRISRTEADGTVVTLVDNWQGGRFNSPNDLVVKSDGSIWFTDPPYGILSDREGKKRDSDLDGNFTYRFAPESTDELRLPEGREAGVHTTACKRLFSLGCVLTPLALSSSWTSARDGVQCYSPAGELLGKILIPEQATANLVCGGRDGKRMYICGDTSLYSVRVKVVGAHRCW